MMAVVLNLFCSRPNILGYTGLVAQTKPETARLERNLLLKYSVVFVFEHVGLCCEFTICREAVSTQV
jgi:hypothetical protein